jgi:hypothetical protein
MRVKNYGEIWGSGDSGVVDLTRAKGADIIEEV